MPGPLYTDEGEEYPLIPQPQAEYVRMAEDEFGGLETTWPEVAEREDGP